MFDCPFCDSPNTTTTRGSRAAYHCRDCGASFTDEDEPPAPDPEPRVRKMRRDGD